MPICSMRFLRHQPSILIRMDTLLSSSAVLRTTLCTQGRYNTQVRHARAGFEAIQSSLLLIVIYNSVLSFFLHIYKINATYIVYNDISCNYY